jgi:hypothetical protein
MSDLCQGITYTNITKRERITEYPGMVVGTYNLSTQMFEAGGV